MSHTDIVLAGGLSLGIAFGALAQQTEFCLAGGLREWWREGRTQRITAFLLAVAVAVLSTQLFVAIGWADVRTSIYTQPQFSWFSVLSGGVLFGYGMMLANGCGARALVLLGEGNLRSLVVLLCLGIAAGATLTGPLATTRIAVADATIVTLPHPTLPALFTHGGAGPLAAVSLAALITTALLGVLVLWGLRNDFDGSRTGGAALIGLLPAIGWWVTSTLGHDDFDPVAVESLTFVSPIGDTLQYLMLSTGIEARFGVAVVGGVLVGSSALALARGRFSLRSFDSPQQTLRAIGGGVLMGVGGANALGCSIGQGLTGLSTLALPSFVAVGGILAGAALAVRGPLRVH